MTFQAFGIVATLKSGFVCQKAATKILAAAAMVCFPVDVAISQSARITSGEHQDFSRLVIGFDRPTEWSIERIADGYRINFDPPAPRLDLSRVFDLIPRDRVEALEQSEEDGSLMISTSCECHLETFVAARWTVALDIKDGVGDSAVEATEFMPTSEDSVLEENVSNSLGNASVQALRTPAIEESRDEWRGLWSWIKTSQEIMAAPPFRSLDVPVLLLPWEHQEAPEASMASGNTARGAERLAEGDDTSPVASATEPLDATGGASDAGGQDEFLAQLQRAAAAGIVEFQTDEAGLWDESSEEAEKGLALGESASRLGLLSDNLDVASLFDALEAADGDSRSETACIPDHQLAFFRAESLEGDGMRALPSLRSSLVDDRGEVVVAAARALIQHYLALGFGAEAAALTNTVAIETEEAELYLSLARIVDDGEDAAPDIWSGQQACDSAAALWSVLGQSDGLRGSGVNTMAVQRAFFDLDIGLRMHLGPGLADRLGDVGHDEAAQSIRSNFASLESPGPEIFSEVAPGAAETAVNDLLNRVERSIRSGRGVSREDLDLAEALAWEYEGTEEGLKLTGMSALGRLQRNDLEGAMGLLESQWQGADPSWTETLEDAFALVVMAKSDADMLRFALHPESGSVLALLDPEQSLELSARLTGLGFPERALDVLAASRSTGDIPETADRRRSRARAILGTGDAMRALALVAGLEDPNAALIRAKAHETLGNHGLSAEAYALAGDGDAAARAAWLSGDDEIVGRYGTDLQKDLATQLDISLGVDAGQETPIAGADADPVLVPGASAAPGTATAVPGAGGVASQAASDPEASPAPVPQNGEAQLAPSATGEAVPTLAEARALIERSAGIRASLDALLPSDE